MLTKKISTIHLYIIITGLLITTLPIAARNGGAVAGGLLGGFALGTIVSNASQRSEPHTTYIYNDQPSYDYDRIEDRINTLEDELYATQQDNTQLRRYLNQTQQALTQLRSNYDHLASQSTQLKSMYRAIEKENSTLKSLSKTIISPEK